MPSASTEAPPHRVERAAEVVRHERGVYREEEEGVDGAVGGAS